MITFAWLEAIILCLFQFSFYERKVARCQFHQTSVSVNTLVTYMPKLISVVEDKIKERLPNKFSTVSYSWTGGDAHYVGVFATFPRDVRYGYETVLLALASMGDGDKLTISEHYVFLNFCSRYTTALSAMSLA